MTKTSNKKHQDCYDIFLVRIKELKADWFDNVKPLIELHAMGKRMFDNFLDPTIEVVVAEPNPIVYPVFEGLRYAGQTYTPPMRVVMIIRTKFVLLTAF